MQSVMWQLQTTISMWPRGTRWTCPKWAAKSAGRATPAPPGCWQTWSRSGAMRLPTMPQAVASLAGQVLPAQQVGFAQRLAHCNHAANNDWLPAEHAAGSPTHKSAYRYSRLCFHSLICQAQPCRLCCSGPAGVADISVRGAACRPGFAVCRLTAQPLCACSHPCVGRQDGGPVPRLPRAARSRCALLRGCPGTCHGPLLPACAHSCGNMTRSGVLHMRTNSGVSLGPHPQHMWVVLRIWQLA